MPEQPLLRTPMRMPTVGLSRLSISAFTRSAAAGVTVMTCGRGRRGRAGGARLAGAGGGGRRGRAGAAGLAASVVVVGVLMTLSLKLLGLLRLGAIVGDRRLDCI